MLLDDSTDSSQLVGREAVVPSEHQRIQPELAGGIASLHVDVWRLPAIEACEEGPIRPEDASDARHSRPPCPSPLLPSC